jgi:hypothetical protein
MNMDNEMANSNNHKEVYARIGKPDDAGLFEFLAIAAMFGYRVS